MAAGTKLELEFLDTNGKSLFFVFPFADPGASSTEVKALINAIIANGDIFAHIPVTAKSAKNVTTSEHEYNLS